MDLLDRISKWLSPRSGEPTASRPQAPGDRDSVIERLRVVVADLSDQQFTPEEIDPHAPLFEEAVIDSMAGVQLLVFIEEQYGVVIEEVELAGGLKSLDDLARRVMENARS